MMDSTHTATLERMLTRRGLLFLPAPAAEGPRAGVREVGAVLLEFVALGYAGSNRLRDALTGLSINQLAELRTFAVEALATTLGAHVKHVPLFRRFPRGIPRDTAALWRKRVLSHYLQAPDQPCLHCQGEGNTHVLRPCEHVVCDRCFDGSNYSACPICNSQVDRSSPFFKASEVRRVPKEAVRFKRLDLGTELETGARALFEHFCARQQALNPADKADFGALINDWSDRALSWLPAAIPLRENVALVVGELFKRLPAAEVLPVARRYLETATDVLRLLAVFSGADAALQGATVYDREDKPYESFKWWRDYLSAHPESATRYRGKTMTVATPRQVKRFPVAKLPRSLRRTLLAILDGFEPEHLIEDMLRHRSYWVWLGEFLHPGEYRRRFPTVARAFEVVRKKNPAGVAAPRFRGFYSRVERAAAAGDAAAMVATLATRPGELGRRFDHALRVAGDDPAAVDGVLATFVAHVGAYSSPVLLTLLSLLPTRLPARLSAQPPARLSAQPPARAKPARRLFWPKGEVAKGVSVQDTRPPLPERVITAAVAAVRAELLRRFAALPPADTAIVDGELANIIVPFNERTASPSAINLPRGSRVAIPTGKTMRLFLHWCEPEGGETTDIDLSVAFYDAAWVYRGVCSYYELTCELDGHQLAKSSGDLTSAPFPAGASEFVDIDREAARAAGVRYAVMVVNAYAGLPFDRLERGFAGLMLRDDVMGQHFDPRTVALKFGLQGANGIFTPLCVDLDGDTLHWLDIYSKGELAMNNVANSSKSISRVCPETIDYFASGIRLDMLRLALLHAAARCRRVVLRRGGGQAAVVLERGAGESVAAFWRRLDQLEGAEVVDVLPAFDGPVLALLHRGDLALPEGSHSYALFRDQLHPTLEAADLIA